MRSLPGGHDDILKIAAVSEPEGDGHSHGQSDDIDEGAYFAFVCAMFQGFGD
jgi:hypothetical protein